jgi:hypothetical protein
VLRWRDYSDYKCVYTYINQLDNFGLHMGWFHRNSWREQVQESHTIDVENHAFLYMFPSKAIQGMVIFMSCISKFHVQAIFCNIVIVNIVRASSPTTSVVFSWLPCGNQTWQTSNRVGGFNRNINYSWWIFNCDVWLPEGTVTPYCLYVFETVTGARQRPQSTSLQQRAVSALGSLGFWWKNPGI